MAPKRSEGPSARRAQTARAKHVADYPGNWTWANQPRPAGPCVLVDVDGVLADGSHRQHFLQGAKRDWKSFFDHAHADQPIEGSVALTSQFDRSSAVVLLTARPHTLHTVTVEWLGTHGFRWELLIMRHRSDGGLSSSAFKQRSVHELQERGYAPKLAIDDDPGNVEMFRRLGLSTLYIHSGYYA